MEGHKDLARLRIERDARPGSARSAWVAVACLVLAAGGFGAYRSLSDSNARRPQVRLGRVERLGGAQGQSGVASNGYVVARRRAALSTDIQGRVVEIAVEEGSRVKQGQLIARLDTSQLAASLARTRAELERQRATARLAGLTHERASTLAASGHGSVAAADEAKAALEEALASVRSLEAARAEIDSQIAKSQVRAPFDGVIVQKNAEVGEVVSAVGAGGGVNARGSVATLVDFSTLEVQIELAQTALFAAREGALVLIYLDAYPEHAYHGRIRQIWPTADRQKASVELRAEFLDRDPRILPEMGARVVFVKEGSAEAKPVEIRVPERALLAGAKPAVFVFVPAVAGGEGAGRVRRQERSALAGGERVVLDPPSGLKDGDEVAEKPKED